MKEQEAALEAAMSRQKPALNDITVVTDICNETDGIPVGNESDEEACSCGYEDCLAEMCNSDSCEKKELTCECKGDSLGCACSPRNVCSNAGSYRDTYSCSVVMVSDTIRVGGPPVRFECGDDCGDGSASNYRCPCDENKQDGRWPVCAKTYEKGQDKEEQQVVKLCKGAKTENCSCPVAGSEDTTCDCSKQHICGKAKNQEADYQPCGEYPYCKTLNCEGSISRNCCKLDPAAMQAILFGKTGGLLWDKATGIVDNLGLIPNPTGDIPLMCNGGQGGSCSGGTCAGTCGGKDVQGQGCGCSLNINWTSNSYDFQPAGQGEYDIDICSCSISCDCG